MADQPDCTTCKFYFTRAMPLAQMCRRHPPVPSVVGLNQTGQPMSFSLYPSVGKGDFCGDHEKKIVLN